MYRPFGRWYKGLVLLVMGFFLQVACSHTMVVSPAKESDRVKLERAVRGRTVKLETREKKDKGWRILWRPGRFR